MPSPLLFTPAERKSLYSCPALTDLERTEYFTFNNAEISALYSFKKIEHALYFAISLAFFKVRYTLINLKYRDVTLERRHIMDRYFPNKETPRGFSLINKRIVEIENKVLTITGFQRFGSQRSEAVIDSLQKQAAHHPRQRQLCKAFLQKLVSENVAIPASTTIQKQVSQVWGEERRRVIRALLRYTNRKQRLALSELLEKTDTKHQVISIRKDMKKFNKADVDLELKKHQQLRIAFDVATVVIPKLNIPAATVEYYANLINYYNGTRLGQLDTDVVHLYLLCYGYTRYQIVNDNLLEAFRSRTLKYASDGLAEASSEAANYVEQIHKVRQQIHDLLMTIIKGEDESSIPLKTLHSCISKDEMKDVAKIIVDEKLDKRLLYWKQIDRNFGSIVITLRPLFLTLDITILRHDRLRKMLEYMKLHLKNSHFTLTSTVPKYVIEQVNSSDKDYIFCPETKILLHPKRLEFFFYQQLAHHIKTNKLILANSIKHKEVEDHLIQLPRWKKQRTKLLSSVAHQGLNLQASPKTLIEGKTHYLNKLYEKTNALIRSGENSDIIIKPMKNGEITWRLRPLDKMGISTDSLFEQYPKRSIASVMKFVNAKTGFSRAFESVLPKSTKQAVDWTLISAVVLANSLRMGVHRMAATSDLNLSSLMTAERAYLRMETLTEAISQINLAAEKLEIFSHYNIAGRRHASLDGLKIGVRLPNILARHSPKFLGQDAGVSTYDIIFNHFPMIGRVIGANEYEGNYTFELAHHQKTKPFQIERASTDKHGMNSLYFALFDLTGMVFAPRIPKPHNEVLWAMGAKKDFDNYLIKPAKFANENHIINAWDDMQRTVVSMLSGEAIPNVVIAKMASGNYRSKTKLGFTHYNHITRSTFLLQYLNDKSYRRAIEQSLNRGEAYNNLYKAITLFNGGKFRGQSQAEILIWDQCSRLVSAVILFYNTYILNQLYLNTTSQEEKEVLLSLTTNSWTHVNLMGFYQFENIEDLDGIERSLLGWDWQRKFDIR